MNGDVYKKESGVWSLVGNIAGPAGVAGAAGADGDTPSWTLAGSYDHAVTGNVTSVPFTGLAGANSILVIGRGLTKANSGVFIVQASVNNGSSYYTSSGDYVQVETTGAETNSAQFGVFEDTNATAARSGWCLIENANNGLALSRYTRAHVNRLFVASTSPINAVLVSPSAGGNITAGKLWCYIR